MQVLPDIFDFPLEDFDDIHGMEADLARTPPPFTPETRPEGQDFYEFLAAAQHAPRRQRPPRQNLDHLRAKLFEQREGREIRPRSVMQPQNLEARPQTLSPTYRMLQQIQENREMQQVQQEVQRAVQGGVQREVQQEVQEEVQREEQVFVDPQPGPSRQLSPRPISPRGEARVSPQELSPTTRLIQQYEALPWLPQLEQVYPEEMFGVGGKSPFYWF